MTGMDYRTSSIQFQFTHPGRGATSALIARSICITSFNSRTPGGVRLSPSLRPAPEAEVSIHAPREGCDFVA